MRILLLLLLSLFAFAEERFVLTDDCWNHKWTIGDTSHSTVAYVDGNTLYYIHDTTWANIVSDEHTIETWAIPAVSLTGMTWSQLDTLVEADCKAGTSIVHVLSRTKDSKPVGEPVITQETHFIAEFENAEAARVIKNGMDIFNKEYVAGSLSDRIYGEQIDMRPAPGTEDDPDYPMCAQTFYRGSKGLEGHSIGRDADGVLNFATVFLNNSNNTRYIPVINFSIFHISPHQIKSISDPVVSGEKWAITIKYGFADFVMMSKILDPAKAEYSNKCRDGEFTLLFENKKTAQKTVLWIRQGTMQ